MPCAYLEEKESREKNRNEGSRHRYLNTCLVVNRSRWPFAMTARLSLQGETYVSTRQSSVLWPTQVRSKWIATSGAFAIIRASICLILLKNLLNLRTVENALRTPRRKKPNKRERTPKTETVSTTRDRSTAVRHDNKRADRRLYQHTTIMQIIDFI